MSLFCGSFGNTEQTIFRTSNITLPVVKEKFLEKLISHKGNIPWPPWPGHYTLQLFLVCLNKPTTISKLKKNIREEISTLPVTENFSKFALSIAGGPTTGRDTSSNFPVTVSRIFYIL